MRHYAIPSITACIFENPSAHNVNPDCGERKAPRDTTVPCLHKLELTANHGYPWTPYGNSHINGRNDPSLTDGNTKYCERCPGFSELCLLRSRQKSKMSRRKWHSQLLHEHRCRKLHIITMNFSVYLPPPTT